MDGGRDRFSRQVAGGVAKGKTIINPIMLRFRPIAPKPAGGGSVPCESPPERKSEFFTEARPKRKYVRAKTNRCKTKKAENGKRDFDRTVLTQPVVPQIAGCEDSMAGGSRKVHFPEIQLYQAQQPQVFLNLDSKPEKGTAIVFASPDQSDLTVLESRVTVECVTDACMEEGGLGSTDVEIIQNLEVDTCPGFVSDDSYKVQWVNLAYRRMVWAEEGSGELLPPETVVQLVVKVELPVAYAAAFACRVRVEYTWRKVKYSRTMPCDVWRMEFGGLGWRLDVKAALSLGR